MGKGERSRAETEEHNLSSRQKEDRSRSAGEMGEGEGGEEGGVGSRRKTGDRDDRAAVRSHCPDAYLQVILGLFFANSTQSACCFMLCC